MSETRGEIEARGVDGVVVCEAENAGDEEETNANGGKEGPGDESEETCGPEDENEGVRDAFEISGTSDGESEKSATIGLVSVTRGARDVKRVSEKSGGSDGVGTSSPGSEMSEIAGVTIRSSMSWVTRSPMLTSKSWSLRSSTRTMPR